MQMSSGPEEERAAATHGKIITSPGMLMIILGNLPDIASSLEVCENLQEDLTHNLGVATVVANNDDKRHFFS